MSRVLLPASAHIICEHGDHVLLIKRSMHIDTWPGYWAFPGGKVEDNEFFRECAFRELEEEVGVQSKDMALEGESLVMYKTVQGIKLGYFGRITSWENAPEILEPHLATDIGWFEKSNLPSPMIPLHKA